MKSISVVKLSDSQRCFSSFVVSLHFLLQKPRRNYHAEKTYSNLKFNFSFTAICMDEKKVNKNIYLLNIKCNKNNVIDFCILLFTRYIEPCTTYNCEVHLEMQLIV